MPGNIIELLKPRSVKILSALGIKQDFVGCREILSSSKLEF